MGKKVTRLFEQFRPENYSLDIDIDKENLKFSGTVIITGKKTGRPSQRLTFHQKDLSITSAKVQKIGKDGPQNLVIDRINLQKSYDEVRLHSKEMIYPGNYIVTMEFSGEITKPMHGLYPTFFKKNDKQDYLLATQFEPNFARQVFPTIDEPEGKATFDLTLTVSKGLTVLSNTPVKKKSTKGTKQTVVFETTPVMSVYLLAWVIGDMHFVETITKDGVIVRSYSTTAQPKEFLKYANNEAAAILDFYANYFKTPFPLKKIDQVALPDFEVGAMENWGLITYREVALLADPVNRSQSSEQYISMVIGHEMSHQWFGNLVTMKWWDDLWLNESFASLMEHISLDHLHPDWFQWEQYAIQDIIASSNRDLYKDVQPVKVEVRHPDEIMTLFDPAIVYAKGGRLLKMLMDYIGEDAFRAGLKSYFAKYAYKNTIRDDLWREFATASGKDINALMDPWLEQSGMPQLDVERSAEGFKLSQKRFILDLEHSTRLWPVPLLTSETLSLGLLSRQTDFIAEKNAKPVIFNAHGSGHMVVRYTDEPSKEFIEQAIVEQGIPPESRINILNDYILLAKKGELSILEALEIVERCKGEPREAVWQQIARVVGTVGGLTEGDDDMEDKLKTLRRSLASTWYKTLGWDDQPDDGPNTKSLRQTMLALMVHGDDKDALAEAKKRYKAVKKVEDLPSEQRALIAGVMVRTDKDVIDSLLIQYQETQNSDLQSSITASLASTKDPKVAAHIIDKALGKDGFVRPQDIFRWYAYMMRSHYTRDAAWKWMTSNWKHLEDIFDGGKSLDHFIVYSATPLNTREWQTKFETFFKPKMKEPALERNIKIALSEIPARVAWRNREEPKIKAYFKQK
jgi:aminopeptidase N